MSDSIIPKLVESFLLFPGIGPRQARRFVYHLLREPTASVDRLIKQLTELKKNMAQCRRCYRYYPLSGAATPSTECELCRDGHRDSSILMVVEKDIDLENIKKSGTYDGHYFVLGGLVPILSEEPQAAVRARELLEQLALRTAGGELKEIILALSANTEGDHTIDYLKKILTPAIEKHGLRISVLGRGLSTGTELEYSDSETLKHALKNRG